jgi:hypothetical protein
MMVSYFLIIIFIEYIYFNFLLAWIMIGRV